MAASGQGLPPASCRDRRQLGGFAARARPAFGMRPTLRFALAVILTVSYVALAVWVSHVWRGEL